MPVQHVQFSLPSLLVYLVHIVYTAERGEGRRQDAAVHGGVLSSTKVPKPVPDKDGRRGWRHVTS